MAQPRDDGAHPVVAKPPCVVGAGYEAVAKGVHLHEWAGLARIREVIGIAPPRKRGTAHRLDGNEARIGVRALDLVAHEGGDEATKI